MQPGRVWRGCKPLLRSTKNLSLMPESIPSETVIVAAGPFGSWLAQTRAFLRGDGGADVPCGDCVGCCVSAYFIPIRPEDRAALANIPAQHLISAPQGKLMMEYLADGSCPMLRAGQCSIYQHRPQTCRDYDCRIFAAAGIAAGGADKVVINRRVRAWRFTYPATVDQQAHDAVQAAAVFIQTQRACFPGGRAPTAPTGIAVLAIKAYQVFLDDNIQTKSATELAAAIIKASREFDMVMPSQPDSIQAATFDAGD